ncbi:MAG: hypothetical protein ACK5P6_07925 [Pseudobdellovibrionaceae bacterium]
MAEAVSWCREGRRIGPNLKVRFTVGEATAKGSLKPQNSMNFSDQRKDRYQRLSVIYYF